MSVDKFGRSKNKGPPGPSGIGFKLDSEENYDVNNKRIVNLSQPANKTDAASKSYVDIVFLAYKEHTEIELKNFSREIQGFTEYIDKLNVKLSAVFRDINKLQGKIDQSHPTLTFDFPNTALGIGL